MTTLGRFPQYVFYNDPSRRPLKPHKSSPNKPEPYVASDELIQAVNLAIYLQRPLLLEGEAGCGKTRLARAVAYELGLPFYTWSVRSTSRAREGLYEYDAILRLHDVQLQGRAGEVTLPIGFDGKPRDPSRPTGYRRFGALGEAFRVEGRPAVVLIDEIDKADVDFPNDLLAVLDEPHSFDIPETGESIPANHVPIVIITSNKEKGNLPAPFLRRCIYHFVDFPDLARLQKIEAEHYRVQGEPVPDFAAAAADRFQKIRDDTSLYKKPGTSEFLDWVEALRGFSLPGQPQISLAAAGKVPFPGLLFKLRPDWERYVRAA
jgi:MoxR-like ATPase